jgi:hypothetical protein
MAKDEDRAADQAAPASVPTDAAAASAPKLEDAKREEDLVHFPHTPEHNRAVMGLRTEIKIPSDLSKVSEAKAKELAEAGLVDDHDLPGKMYRRKADGFTTRIPDYTFNAYAKDLQEEWDEVKLPTDEPPKGKAE